MGKKIKTIVQQEYIGELVGDLSEYNVQIEIRPLVDNQLYLIITEAAAAEQINYQTWLDDEAIKLAKEAL